MKLTRIWFEDNRIYGLTDTGNTVWQSLLWYKRLNAATKEQRNDYEMDEEGEYIGMGLTKISHTKVLNTTTPSHKAFPAYSSPTLS